MPRYVGSMLGVIAGGWFGAFIWCLAAGHEARAAALVFLACVVALAWPSEP